MGEYITATEASRRYAISEKTIRTWLKTGKLPAHKTKVDGLDQWQINTEDIEQVIALKYSRIDTTGIVLVEMQREIDELKAEIDALKQSREPHAAQPPPTAHAEPARSSVAHSGAIVGQPPNTLTLQELSERVQRDKSGLLSHLKKYDKDPEKYPQFEHIRIPVAARPGWFTRYFTEGQAERIAAWITENTNKSSGD